ncbi:MAG: hypothetical protein HYY62_01465 [Deltaproteobacteria bacterium]|nr:hypothetical protein [Deltaproteobacteria bacterium]
MNKKTAILFFLLLVIPSTARNLFAQEATPPSIFDEGTESTIRPEDIGEDVKLWAQNTALKFKKLLSKIKKLSVSEKRNLMLKTIQESVEEAQGKRELLLMRFSLNRALRLEQEFRTDDDALVLNHILLPAVKQAITLYEQSDLPYLEANKDKPEGEIEPPPYAAYTKINIGYLLNASNMNKTLEGQFNILGLSLAWVGNDLLRSPKARRNSVNADLILKIQNILEELKSMPTDQITYALNNKLRTTLLEMAKEIVSEAQTQMAPPLSYNPESISKDTLFLPPPAPIEPKKSSPPLDLSFLKPQAALLICESQETVGLLVVHSTTKEAGESSIEFECKGTGGFYKVTLFGIGLGGLYAEDSIAIEYFGLGDITGTYFGPRVSVAIVLEGNIGFFTNGASIVTLAGGGVGFGAAASISMLKISSPY